MKKEQIEKENLDIEEINPLEKNIAEKINIVEKAKLIINETKEKINKQKEENKTSYEKLQNDLKNFLIAIEGTSGVYKKDKHDLLDNQKAITVIKEIDKIQEEIMSLVNDLELKINNKEKEISFL